jgi:hypothetical protein
MGLIFMARLSIFSLLRISRELHKNPDLQEDQAINRKDWDTARRRDLATLGMGKQEGWLLDLPLKACPIRRKAMRRS